jgi:plasmid stabilization system protein ParE
MTLPIIALPGAESELSSANSYYLSKSPTVASRFRSAASAAIQDIRSAPLRWSVWRQPDYRRYLLPRFPYMFVYRALEHEVVVVTLIHQQQDSSHRFPEDP